MVIVRPAQEQHVPHVAADIAGTDRDLIHPRPTHHPIRPCLMAGVVAAAAVHQPALSLVGRNPVPLWSIPPRRYERSHRYAKMSRSVRQ